MGAWDTRPERLKGMKDEGSRECPKGRQLGVGPRIMIRIGVSINITIIKMIMIMRMMMTKVRGGLGCVLISPAGLRMLRGRRNAYPHIVIIIIVIFIKTFKIIIVIIISIIFTIIIIIFIIIITFDIIVTSSLLSASYCPKHICLDILENLEYLDFYTWWD